MSFLGDIGHVLLTADLWRATLEAAALLLLPALGGVISERSGVVNIAMEGMMLTGAFFAVVADLAWHNAWLAALVGIVAGGLMALIHAVVSIRFRADQIVSGIAINIFAAGLTLFLVQRIYGLQDVGHVGQSNLLPYVDIPLVDQIPFVGRVLFQQNVVVYAAIVLLVVVQIVLFRTRLGLRIRAVGEHPQAADTAGINVYAIRYGAVITSGLLSGLQHLRAEHDGRARVHRARGDDLRQVEAAGRFRRMPHLRTRPGHLRRQLGHPRVAIPPEHAALHPHPRRPRGGRGPQHPAGSRRPALRTGE
jgi:ribose/xylose/arabinose/galactoside ABC-type transport system permease subunit